MKMMKKPNPSKKYFNLKKKIYNTLNPERKTKQEDLIISFALGKETRAEERNAK